MDWILASHVLKLGLFPAFLLTIIIIIVGMVSFFVETIDDDLDAWKEGAKKLIKPALIAYGLFIITGVFVVLANMPNVLVKSNIARIKLRYTDMATVQKMEVGAEEVVSKLSKLIDAGIEKAEQ